MEFQTEEEAKENERSPSVVLLCAGLLRRRMVYELERVSNGFLCSMSVTYVKLIVVIYHLLLFLFKVVTLFTTSLYFFILNCMKLCVFCGSRVFRCFGRYKMASRPAHLFVHIQYACFLQCIITPRSHRYENCNSSLVFISNGILNSKRQGLGCFTRN